MRTRTLLLAPIIVALAALLVGCFETTVPLTEKPGDCKVDRALVGDWTFPGEGGKTVSLIVRNLDDKQYYVEWSSEGDETIRAVAIVDKIKDVPFAQVRPLTPDGSVSEKHWIMRVSTEDNKLGVRQLDGDWFSVRAANTTAQLRKLIEENLDNKDMYKGEFAHATKKS